MKKIIKQFMTIGLALVVILNASGYGSVYTYAEEWDEGMGELGDDPTFIDPVYPGKDDPTPTPTPDPTPIPTPDPTPIPTPEPTPDPEPIKPVYPVYNLGVTQDVLYFDNLYEGASADSMCIGITNYSNIRVSLGWSQAGDNVFSVITDYGVDVDPGESTAFIIRTDDYLTAGDYAGSLTIWPQQDETRASQVTIRFYAHVEKKIVPIVTGVSISPENVSMKKDSTVRFDANVQGRDLIDSSVTYRVKGAKSSDTYIDAYGNLYVASNETATSLKVTVTSNQDSSFSATAKVSVDPGNVQVVLQASPKEGGVVTGDGTYKKGSRVTLQASANNGYVFVGWSKDGTVFTVENRLDIPSIDSNLNIVANFRKSYVYIKTDMSPASGAGTVTQSNYYPYLGDAVLEANPQAGYRFTGWKENNQIISQDSKLKLNKLSADRSITACFEKVKSTIQTLTTDPNGGTVTGAGVYDYGTNVTVTATPYKGYVFNGWYCNNKLVGIKNSFTIPDVKQDYCLVAAFMKENQQTHTVFARVEGAGGTISPTGKISVAHGGAVMYSIIPKKDYKVESVVVDGVNVGTNTSYTFTAVTDDHEIVVKFSKKASDSANDASVVVVKDTTNTNKKTDKSEESKPVQLDDKTLADDAEHSTVEDILQDVDLGVIPEDLNMDDVIPTVNGNDLYVDNSDVDYSKLTGVLAEYSISRSEAQMMIEAGEGEDLFKDAYQEGYIQMTVNNDFTVDSQVAGSTTYALDPSISNFDEVMASMLSMDDILDALSGETVAINVDITEYTNSISWDKKKIMEVMADEYDVQIEDYFDISIIKTLNGNSSLVSDFGGKTAYFVLKVPKNLMGEDLKIMHLHTNADGSVEKELLEDLDNNPDTFTVGVDKLSIFAFVKAYEHPVWVVVVKIVVVILGILFMAALTYIIVMSVRKAKRHHAKLKAMRARAGLK